MAPDLNNPEKENLWTPFPSSPSVVIYLTLISSPSSPAAVPNFLPKYPSPNFNSYLSSWTSLIKKIFEVESTVMMSFIRLYSVPLPSDAESFIFTTILEVSIEGLS